MGTDEGRTPSDLTGRIREAHDATTEAVELIHNGDLGYALMTVRAGMPYLGEVPNRACRT
jgi:hypothetical protein